MINRTDKQDTKIFVVQDRNSGSQYGSICAIFTSETMAKKYVGLNYMEYSIKEWPLDKYIDELNNNHIAFVVSMTKGGMIIDVKETDLIRPVWIDIEPYDWKEYNIGYDNELIHWCYAKDEQHAIKITDDLRISLLNDKFFKWKRER